MKNNRGAISIEMIITVIVLIILAGISIFMLTGENGLFVPKNNQEQTQNTNNTTVDSNQELQNNENGENAVITE